MDSGYYHRLKDAPRILDCLPNKKYISNNKKQQKNVTLLTRILKTDYCNNVDENGVDKAFGHIGFR